MSDSDIRPIAIVDELKTSYLDYAMSVIVSRALPDIRDGLKPVHRRALFAMHELNNDYNKPYLKSARVVGDVIGKYHPHGDTAVYDTLVRMAQPFSMRYMLVDGQGNFGSVDGDNPAAMRYTEIRMQKLTHQMLADLEKDTVDWEDNYDGKEKIPTVLPTRVPNLLINGAAGIAVGMATNMAPHNLTEVMNACIAYVDDNHISIEGLMEHISGPDFPTGGTIYGQSGIVDAYRTGKGRLHIRGNYFIEDMEGSGERKRIVFNEIPYQVNKAKLIVHIAALVNDKKIEGISAIRDESDKEGMRVVIDLKRGENPDVVVNNLFKQTPLETSFSINMVALDNGQPRLMNLMDLISAFVRHRQEVVTRRTIYERNKARVRGHILEGYTVALANIDDIIETIKTSSNRAHAKERLLGQTWRAGDVVTLLEKAGSVSIRPEYIEGEDPTKPYGLLDSVANASPETQYRLSPMQVDAILELQLHRLTSLEKEKIHDEYFAILATIADLQDILDNFDRLMSVIRDELVEVRENFGDERSTDIVASRIDFSRADLIPEQEVVLTVSQTGYAKTQPLSDYAAQRRGGKGKSATSMKDDDFIEHLVVTSTHNTVMCFTDRGRVFWLKVFDVPVASRGARGRPLVNLIPLEEAESVTAILPLAHLDDEQYLKEHFVCFATSKATVKRVALEHFSRPRSSGLIAINLNDDDTLVGVKITDGKQQIMLFADNGKAVRFDEEEIRAMGRTASGVRGMRIADEDAIQSLVVIDDVESNEVLIACENGFGKRTKVAAFRQTRRGSQGVIAINTSERNGKLVRAAKVTDEQEVLLITDQGTLVRTRVSEIATAGRNAQGVTLIRTSEDERLVRMACFDAPEDAEDSAEENSTEENNAEKDSADDAAESIATEASTTEEAATPEEGSSDED